ncbi:MAG: GntP family permease [Paludisphaera borealis]|uniref:GntP family permease n=1 Tax=Paludisphaera borealis TaxID=1387353 RepID=UPI00284A1EDE|nr:GntP family permease [Paludisphaera borealis]MDR3618979.1 GntP family permease [Paludisphaera borealis]
MLGVAAIVFSLVLLMAIAYRGLPVIVFAPICAAAALALAGVPILPGYTDSFMNGAADYVRAFFPVFLLGAIFGKLMEAGGAAASIARAIVRAFGSRRAIPAVVLACAVLTYGGVSLFVVAFAVYPFGAALFKAAGIPKRLLPGAIALGAFTLTMDALPGSPQIQNLIPTRTFGTDAYAAPVLGCVGGAAILIGGLIWLDRRRAWAAAAGEGYGAGHANEPEPKPDLDLPSLPVALLPLLLVLAANFVASRTPWSIAGWYSEDLLRGSFPTINVRTASPTWALITALCIGITATLALNARRLRGSLTVSLTAATSGALLAIFNTASEVGYGSVIKTLPGFQVIRNGVLGLSQSVLISEAVAVNILSGITGSASGGLSIALEVMGAHYLEAAKAQGISPEWLHRIASMASGGMDTLPHNGAVITLLAITGLTHRQSYPDIFAITLLKTSTVFALAAAATAWA